MRHLPGLLALCLLLTACSDDSSPSNDKPDMAQQPDLALDQSVEPDLNDDDDAPADGPDLADQADQAPDLPGDMGDDLGDVADMMDAPDQDSACMYFDYDIFYVRCGQFNMYHLLRKLEDRDLGPERCPVYYTLKGNSYPSAEAAMAAEQCEASCQYVASMSVSLLHCERRTGYIKYTADGCPDIYEFPEGVYPSVELWRMANPCPG